MFSVINTVEEFGQSFIDFNYLIFVGEKKVILKVVFEICGLESVTDPNFEIAR